LDCSKGNGESPEIDDKRTVDQPAEQKVERVEQQLGRDPKGQRE